MEEMNISHYESLFNIIEDFDESIFKKISTKTALIKLVDYSLLEQLENQYPTIMHLCKLILKKICDLSCYIDYLNILYSVIKI